MIGIFDSGVGGLSVYREVRKALPEASVYYFGDTAWCPYGPRERGFIIERAEAITEMLIKEADIIVIACNTATAAAISHLRARYSDSANPQVRERVLKLTGGRRDHIRFIGMEPAIKPAVAITKTGTVGVLATESTLNAEKYNQMKDLYKGDVTIIEQVGEGFVELVEKWDLSSQKAEVTVRKSISPLLNAGADTIVLGCTHYPFLLDTMRKIAGPQISFIDPAPAVARHLVYVLVQDRLLDEHSATQVLARLVSGDVPGHEKNTGLPSKPDVTLLSSGDPEPLRRIFDKIFG